MSTLIKIMLRAMILILAAYLLPEAIQVNSTYDALGAAILVGVLNIVLKPILIILTIPITLVTLGLFLIIINAILLEITDYFLDGFTINGFGWAIILSIMVSVPMSILENHENKHKKRERENRGQNEIN